MTMRASDDDRRRVVTSLEHHTAAGRLRLDEFDQRVAAALAAVTLDDLARVTSDLPAEPAPTEDDPEHSRALLVAFGLAAITIILLAVVLAVAR